MYVNGADAGFCTCHKHAITFLCTIYTVVLFISCQHTNMVQYKSIMPMSFSVYLSIKNDQTLINLSHSFPNVNEHCWNIKESATVRINQLNELNIKQVLLIERKFMHFCNKFILCKLATF